MKSSKIIKLLSALLCVVMMLASCGEAASLTDESGVETLSAVSNGVSALSPVVNYDEANAEQPSLTWKDLLEIKSLKDETVKNVAEIEGEPVYVDGLNSEWLQVFRTVDVDVKNVVTETYKFYNFALGKVVLTLENSYENVSEQYGIQESELEINVESYYNYEYNPYANVIVVERAKNVFYTEEEKEANFRIESDYYTEYSYEYYDFYGNLLVKTNDAYEVYIESTGTMFGANLVVIGSSAYRLDTFGKLVASNKETDFIFIDADYLTENYAYYLDANLDLPFARGGIQIFDVKTAELVYQRGIGYNSEYSASVLENGNVLVQELKVVSDPLADYELNYGGDKVNLESFIIDVATGEEKSVELDCLIDDMIPATEYAALLAEAGSYGIESLPFSLKGVPGVNLTGSIAKIENKELSRKSGLFYFDNEANLLLEVDIYDLPRYELSNGSAIYYVDGVYKIVAADGAEMLLPSDVRFEDEYFIADGKLYSYDLKAKCEFEEESYLTTIGDYYITYYLYDNAGTLETRYKAYYYTSDDSVENGGYFDSKDVFADEYINRSDIGENYIVSYNGETGVYKLYNAELNVIFATRYSSINVIDDFSGKLFAYSDGSFYEFS